MYNSPTRFCPGCGGLLSSQFVEEEGRDRLVCKECAEILYINPKVVAGVIPEHQGGVWLLRRAIEPCYGTWTFPAGFMEMGEAVEQAAERETWEELGMRVAISRLVGIYSRPESPTVLIVYAGTALTEPTGGMESLEFALTPSEHIPWDGLAFWNTHAALQDWVRSQRISGIR